MKIGVDIRVLMDENYSGVSEYTHNLLEEILKQDNSNEYKLFYNSFQNIDQHLAKWNTKNSQLVAARYPNKLFNYLLQKVFSYPKIDKLLGGVDLFWSPHFNFTKLSVGSKKIITIHDLSFLRYPHFFSFRKNFWHWSLGVKRIIREADLVVAVSENTKNDIVELVGISSHKVRVVYSGNNIVKKELNQSAREDFLRSCGITKPFILYLGNIEPRKNISGIIKAYNQLRADGVQVELVLAGAQGWKNRKIIQDWKASPYQGDIKFLGYISREQKEMLYSSAVVFVYPSFYEGFGFPPLEAMTYGLPVVCSYTSSLPEVVGSAALSINPFKTTELAESIKMIIENKDVGGKLIARGYEQSQRFTWEETAQKYLELFREIKNDSKEK